MPVVGITGGSGYVGGVLTAALRAAGWRVVWLTRAPPRTAAPDVLWRHWDLRAEPDPALLRELDLLVHAAHDWHDATAASDPANVNVRGTARLLSSADRAGVAHIVLVSSIAAAPGTPQRYGQVKLAIERLVAGRPSGVCVLRPGLIYGSHAGGIIGTLRRLTRLPVLPLPGASAMQHYLHEEELGAVVAAAVAHPHLYCRPLTVAHSQPIRLAALMRLLAALDQRRPRLLPVPWRLAHAGLRGAEVIRLPLPLRSDSLLGLMRAPTPSLSPEVGSMLGVQTRPMTPERFRPQSVRSHP